MPENARHNPHQEIKAYKEALRTFTEAWGNLTESWGRLEFAGANVPEGGYPFTESFDELYHRVLGWAKGIESNDDPGAWNVASDVAPVTAAKIAEEAHAAVAQYRTRQAALKK